MDYLATIRRGWEISWNHKFMLLLGFLAALGSGSAFSNSNYSVNSGDTTFLQQWLTPERAAALSAGLIGFACVAFIVGIVLWLVSLAARGGLIAGAAALHTGSASPTFGSAFRAGWRRLPRLVGMTIVLYIVPAIIGVVLTVGLVGAAGGAAFLADGMDNAGALAAGMGGVALVFLCLLCLLVPLALLLSLIYPFAFRGIVLRDMGAIDSIRHGWQTVRNNIGELILLALAFFLINVIILIVGAAVLVPVALVIGVPLSMLADTNASVLTGILAALGIIVGLFIFALVAAIATSWQSSTFTVAYLRWTGKNVSVDLESKAG